MVLPASRRLLFTIYEQRHLRNPPNTRFSVRLTLGVQHLTFSASTVQGWLEFSATPKGVTANAADDNNIDNNEMATLFMASPAN